MTLPLLLSVPHAGLRTPPEVESFNILPFEEIARDGDEGAAEIYDLENQVSAYVTTEIARAFVDMNRAVDDFRPDGVVKTHTCWNVPIYREPLSGDLIRLLIETYHRPYHFRLTEESRGVRLGIDCHTMAAVGPPVGPDEGQKRPRICLSNADETCPREMLESLAECFQEEFGTNVSLNAPFKGGHIIRAHAKEIHWVQLELSREDFMSNAEKRTCVISGLEQWLLKFS